MSERQLVFILPVEKRPAFCTYYGREKLQQGPLCHIEPNGEVYMYSTGTIPEVQAVLAAVPYEIEFEELKEVYIRE